MSTEAVRVVSAWHDALNRADIDRLTALSTDDVEVGGPRGSGSGSDLLREWVGRAGLGLDIRRVFCRGAAVVVEEDAEWRAADTGAVTGSQTAASVFRVRDGRVASVIRHPGLADALNAAGLGEADEVQQM